MRWSADPSNLIRVMPAKGVEVAFHCGAHGAAGPSTFYVEGEDQMTLRTSKRLISSAAVAAASLLVLAGCSLTGAEEPGGDSITLVTHDSFAVSDETLAAFTEQTGITVTQVAPGNGGALVNQLVLTKESPLGDLAFGVSDTFASRGIAEGVFAPYTSPNLPESAKPYLLGDALTPIDFSDVCLNADLAWFESHDLTPPATFDDLLLPEYSDLTVVTNPATSSPGLNFLVATIAAQGEDGWADYWAALRNNGLKVVDGWSDAYYVDFTGAGGDGDRPIVLSYSSSPPFTLDDDGQSTTVALLETCSRQIEYAGVLEGAKNPEGARAFIDFMLSEQFQSELPEQMYVYPIDSEVALPSDWAQFAPKSPAPFALTPEQIDAGRTGWIEEWTSVVLE